MLPAKYDMGCVCLHGSIIEGGVASISLREDEYPTLVVLNEQRMATAILLSIGGRKSPGAADWAPEGFVLGSRLAKLLTCVGCSDHHRTVSKMIYNLRETLVANRLPRDLIEFHTTLGYRWAVPHESVKLSLTDGDKLERMLEHAA